MAKSAALVKDPAFSTIVRLPHADKPAQDRPEVFVFADHYARGGRDVVRFPCVLACGDVLSARVDVAGRKIARARLVWTTSGDDDWTKRPYEEREITPFDTECGRLAVKLPACTRVAFVALDTEDGLVFSTPPQIDPLR